MTKSYICCICLLCFSTASSNNFSGISIGFDAGSVGANWRHTVNRTANSNNTVVEQRSVNFGNVSWVAGINAGYDYALTEQWLIGFHPQITYTDLNITTSSTAPLTNFDHSMNQQLKFIYSLPIQLGYAQGKNAFFFQVGAAAADFKFNHYELFTGETERISQNRTRWGWTTGIGYLYQFWKKLAFNVKLNYTQFSSYQIISPGRLNTTLKLNLNNQIVTGTVGVVYYF